MTDVRVNQFNALCPTCRQILVDRTYIDRKGEWYFFRTIFECEGDNWALMTRLDEYNSIALVNKTDMANIMQAAFAQIKLDLVMLVIADFIADGVRNYPLDTVEKFMKNGDTFYSKKMTGTASAFLHIFYRDLAAEYGQRSDAERQFLALQAAVDYLKRMAGDELCNTLQNDADRRDALQIFSSFANLCREQGNLNQAAEIVQDGEIWRRQRI